VIILGLPIHFPFKLHGLIDLSIDMEAKEAVRGEKVRIENSADSQASL